MHAPTQPATSAVKFSPLRELVRFVILLAPAVLLFAGGWFSQGNSAIYLHTGGAVASLIAMPRFLSWQSWYQPLLATAVPLYLLGFAVLWISAPQVEDWYVHLVQGFLLFVPMLLLAGYTLNHSDAMATRRAWRMVEKLCSRHDWPDDLMRTRALPEVKLFRELLKHDPSPALHVLGHPRPEIRLIAVSALEGRHAWQPGQAEQVLQAIQEAAEPELQAAGIAALAHAEDRFVVEGLAGYFNHECPAVRRAATESVLWDLKQRWPWLREVLRISMSNMDLAQDGPLPCNDPLLPQEAVDDLTAWAAAKGILGIRAAETLGLHYRQVLEERSDEELVQSLRRKVVDPQSAPALRIELAKLLQAHGPWGMEMLERMLDSSNPAPLRLIAVESVLASGQSRSAMKALRDLAYVPNREIALATATLVQKKLRVDLGVPADGELPSVYSAEAVTITERLQEWASSAGQRVVQVS